MDLEEINFFFLINLLPPEILGQILRSGLSVIDRLLCERVSRHWRWTVLELGWTEQRKLDADIIFKGRRDRMSLQMRFTNESLISLFRRVRYHLVELDLRDFLSSPTVNVVPMCAQLHLLPKLAKLDVRFMRVNADLIVRCFPEALRELKLEVAYLEERHLTAIEERCPRLDSLKIAGGVTSGIPMPVMNAFISGYPGLKKLSLGALGLFKDLPMERLASIGQLKALEELELFRMFGGDFNDAALNSVVWCCRRLRRLAFDRTLAVSEQALFQLAKMPNLTKLEVREGHTRFTEAVLKAIAQRGQLKKISISGSQQLTEEAVFFLIVRCKSLVSLNISRCRLISQKVWLEAIMMGVRSVRWEK